MVTVPGDFVTAVDEKNIIVVKELEPNDGHAELEKIAENMYTLLKEDRRRRYSDSIWNSCR